jgi:hypothetical protein
LSQSDTSFFDLKKQLKKKAPGKITLSLIDPKKPQVNKASVQLLRNKMGTSKYGTVYALPQDNMPCIAPDMSQHQIMPNAGSNRMFLQHADSSIYIPNKLRRKS